MPALNLTTAKTFRQYAAVEGVNHPEVAPFFEHAQPDGDAISPAGVLLEGAVIAPEFTVVAATDLLTTEGHGLVATTPIRFTTTGTLPAGLSLATTYYVIASGLTVDDFRVSAASGGSTINITDTGTGTHSWARYLTADELTEVTLWQSDRNDLRVNLPVAILWITAYKAYEASARHKAWLADDYLQRHWQWTHRSADHADAAQTVSPPSASETGDIPDPPPPVPADRSPN